MARNSLRSEQTSCHLKKSGWWPRLSPQRSTRRWLRTTLFCANCCITAVVTMQNTLNYICSEARPTGLLPFQLEGYGRSS